MGWLFGRIRAVSMPAADKSLAIFELERKTLRALCRERLDGPARADLDAQSRAAAVSELLLHNWQDAEHRIVFEALARLPGRDAAELRRQLPAQATRMGFPDVQWETYFASGTDDAKSAESHGELELTIRQLREVSSEAAS
ncbi:MAG: hypothetical protein WA690_13265 [Candidatus Acidiferrales bacterium]